MAFTYTRTSLTDFGNKRVALGTYASSGGGTGGAMVTGLTTVEHFNASVATSTPSTVATISAGTVTITTTANQTGTWMAVGT